jgi:hypothetical protein
MNYHRLSPREAARLVGVVSTNPGGPPTSQRTESKAESTGVPRTPEGQPDAGINRGTEPAPTKPGSANVDL